MLLVLLLVLSGVTVAGCRRSGGERVAGPDGTGPGGAGAALAGDPALEKPLPELDPRLTPLELLLQPEEAGGRPEVRAASVGDNLSGWLLDGVRPRAFLSPSSPALKDTAALVADVLGSGAGEVTLHGPWYQVWPRVVAGFGDRPVVQLYYGRLDDTGPRWRAGFETKFKAPEGLPASSGGRLRLQANALYLAPAVAEGQQSWLVSTAEGLPDARQDRFNVLGFTRSGEVVVIRLEPSEALRRLGQALEAALEAAATPPGAEAALAKAREAEKAERWKDALAAYERVIDVLGGVGQQDPEVLFGSARAGFRRGLRTADTLLDASYLAEQQGRTDVLEAVVPFMRGVAVDLETRYPGRALPLWRRVVELAPTDGQAWWKLASLFPPALAAAERMAPGGADAPFMAGVYFRQAGERLANYYPGKGLEEARALVEKGLALVPNEPYGSYLAGVLAGSLDGDPIAGAAKMREVLALSPGQPEASLQLAIYEAAEAGGCQPSGTWDLGKPGEQHGVGGRAPLWSPDGRRLVVSFYLYAPQNREELVIVDRPSGAVARLPVESGRPVAWSPDSEWLYFRTVGTGTGGADGGGGGDGGGLGGLMKVRWNGQDLMTLAPFAWSADLSPDGSQIAYNDGGLWLVSAAGGTPVRLTDGPQDGLPLWFPDGRHLLFAHDTGQGGGDGAPHTQVLAVADALSPGKGETLGREDIFCGFTWLSPGEVVGVVSGWDDVFEWSILRLGQEETGADIAANLVTTDFYATWLPGKGAAIVYPRDDRVNSPLDLSLLDYEGKKVASRQISGFEGYPGLLRVGNLDAAADGSVLVLELEGPGGPSLWAADPGGLDLRFIAAPPRSGIPSVSPDGKLVAFYDGSTLRVYDVP